MDIYIENNIEKGFKVLWELIKKSKNILVIPHIDPDADALGSAYALSLIVSKMGKNVHVGLNSYDEQKNSFFLPFHEKFAIYDFYEYYDLMISVDCGSLNRLGKYSSFFNEEKVGNFVNIDHHMDNSNFGEYNIVSSNYSSTCELVFCFFYLQGLKIDKDIASLLYAGIIYDTGSFRYLSSSRPHLVADKLVSYSIDVEYIHSSLFESWEPETLTVLSKVYNTLERFYENKIVLTYLKKKFYNKKSELTSFVKIGLSIKGTLVSIHMVERGENLIQISLRSRKNIKINHIAALYNGGGHPNAAAFIIENNFNEVKNIIIKELIPRIKDQIVESKSI